MRAPYLSTLSAIFFTMALLMTAACDTREEKVEVIPPVQGSLLEHGRVPDISPEGAAEVKKMIENISFVKQYKTLFAAILKDSEDLSEEAVEVRGELQVVPQGDAYMVTLPERTTFNMPEGDDVKSIQIYHKIGLIVRPTGDPQAWRIEFVSDQEPIYAVINREGEAPQKFLSVTYTNGEPIKALWHNEFQMFAQLQGSLKNLAMDVTIPEQYRKDMDNIDSFKVQMADVISDVMLQPDENNLWSGPYNGSFGNMDITLPQQVGKISVLDMNAKYNFQKLNPVVYSEFFTLYNNMVAELYSKPPEEAKNVDYLPLIKAYKKLMTDGFESSDFLLAMSNIMVKLNKTPKNPGAEKVFGLEKASLEAKISRDQANQHDMSFNYTLKGLDIGMKQFEEEFGGEAPQELVPQNLSFGMGIQKLPVAALFDKAIEILEQGGNDEKKTRDLFLQKKDEVIDLLSAADTKLKVNDTYIGNDIWLLLVNGVGNMNKDAVMKVDGETDVRFYNMDLLMQVMDKRMKDAATPPQVRMMLEQSMTGMGMMQMFGQQKKDDNGRDYRGYTFTLTPQGELQMNGTNMTQMMGMF